MPLHAGLRIGAALMCGSVGADAFGADFGARLGYTAEYTTNAQRTTEGPISEWSHLPRLSLDGSHEGPSTDLSIGYDITRRIRSKQTSLDDTVMSGRGTFNWYAIPSRLSFGLNNTATLSTIDSREQNTPQNQQVTFTTTASSDLTMQSFGAQTIVVGIRASDRRSESKNAVVDSDSQTVGGNLAYLIPLEATSSLRFSASADQVRYSNPDSLENTAYAGNLEFTRTLDRLSFNGRVGYGYIDYVDDIPSTDGPTGALSLTLQASSATTLTASVSQSFRDDSANVTVGRAQFGDELTETATPNEVFVDRTISLNLTSIFGANTFELRGSASNQTYQNVDREEDRYTAGMGLSRRMRRDLSGRFFVTWRTNDFVDIVRSDDEFDARLSLSLNRWRRVGLNADVGYFTRVSSDITQEYDEWRGSISLTVQIAGR